MPSARPARTCATRSARPHRVPGWAGKTAMNRGQVLYRVAELMEGRRDQFVAEVAAAEGLRDARAREVVDRAIDRWVWYAGWADKITQILGPANPVAAPYFNFTIPEPTGVVGIVAPETSSLLGLVSGSRRRSSPATAVVLLTSESPAAAGHHAQRGPRHVGRARRRRQRPDRAPEGARPGPRRPRRRRRARYVGRARRHAPRDRAARRRRHQAPVRRPSTVNEARFDWLDDRAAERPEWIAAFLEMKTVWHPIGGLSSMAVRP